MLQKLILVICAMPVIVLIGCQNDELPPVERPEVCNSLQATFVDVQPIVDAKCGTAGCHNAGSTFGDYSSYERMLDNLESGEVGRRTLDFEDMPPAGSPELTEEERQLIQCWLLDGFPKQ